MQSMIYLIWLLIVVNEFTSTTSKKGDIEQIVLRFFIRFQTS